jgi:hypothetical protein
MRVIARDFELRALAAAEQRVGAMPHQSAPPT